MKTPHLAVAAFLAFSSSVFCQFAAQAQSAPSGLRTTSPRTISKSASPTVAANYGKLPLSFEANQGQADPYAKFLSHGNGYSLLLTDTAAVLELSKLDPASHRPADPRAAGMSPAALAKTRRPVAMKNDVVRMELAGARHNSSIAGADPLPGKSNYFVGNDSTKWHTNIPTYSKVEYSGVYPGVDLVYYGNQRQLEYDFVVAPGASSKPVKLHFVGAAQLKLNSDGDLAVIARNGEIAFHKPVVYQEKDGQRQPVEGKFTLLAKSTVGFQLGDYDHSRELVIDPVLAYSTYLTTGTANALAVGMALDSAGDVFIAGPGLGYPATSGSYQFGSDSTVSVIKLNPAGTALVYSTSFGGTPGPADYQIDTVSAIAVDSAGTAYVTGSAGTTNYPVTPGAYQTVNYRDDNSFITKLNPSGSALVYSTFLGGTGGELGESIALDSSGNAYVAGITYSTDFPVTSGAFQSTPAGGYVTKLNPTGSGLIYSTYLGGTGNDWPTQILVDGSGNAYVNGSAQSTDFPVTPGAFATTPANSKGISYGGYVTKLNPSGSALLYSTYFPSGSLAIDEAGSAYVAGTAPFYTFPLSATPGAFQTQVPPQSYAAFVAKLSASGRRVVCCTFLGGENGGYTGAGARNAPLYPANSFLAPTSGAIAVDSSGDAYVTGYTFSTSFPVTPDAYQATNKAQPIYNGTAAFFTEFNPLGSALIYSTYLSGSGTNGYGEGGGEAGTSVMVDTLGNAYVAGFAGSSDFPTTPGAYESQNTVPNMNVGNLSSFLTKFAFHGATTTTLTSDSNPALVGSNVTLIAQISSDQNSITPGGLVEFHIDGTLAAAPTLDGSGQATYATTTLKPGVHTIEALYRGGPSHSASSGFLTQTITGQVAAPDIVPVSGTYHSAQNVAISDTTTGAVIHYTTNGDTPTTASPIYSAPIPVTAATTIKAIATATGDTQSALASATYNISSAVKPVTVSFTPSPATLTYGEPLTLTATVTTTDSTTATGTITFLHGSVPIGTVSLSGGKATLTTSSLEPGEYSLTANYSGSATEEAKQSPAFVVNLDE